MIHVLESRLRQMRRWLSRSEWSLRFLGLSKIREPGAERGLVLIQIDGLSRLQLEKAIKRGRMPFLRRLQKREGYHLQSVYSGLPSTTAAAQAELFYGIKGAIPAFAYRDRTSGKYMKLITPECAARVESELVAKGRGLCQGGSAYFDMYSGGAKESHFCASGMGASALLKNSNSLGLLAVLLWNFGSLLRLTGLLLLEFVIAVYDSIRGVIARGEVRQELLFVFSRVFVCVGLRELITVLSSMDVARGLPIVHVNFVGYDEQSHRRGPSSKFAHFSLRGIDNSIKRIWLAAHRSYSRDYDVWIYSDHGQESAIPFFKENHRTLESAVSAVLNTPVTTVQIKPAPEGRIGRNHDHDHGLNEPGMTRPRRERSQHTVGNRAESYLLREMVAGGGAPETIVKTGTPAVIAVGPLGHIYLPGELDPGLRDGLARRLVDKANIPLVLFANGPGKARAVTAEGGFQLPEEANKVLGDRNPFLDVCAKDLVAICHHVHSGDFVISGWRRAGRPVTFVWENGAHGGPGYEETHAFGLFPGNAPLAHDCKCLRYETIREAALHVRGQRTPTPDFSSYPRRPMVSPAADFATLANASGAALLRVMTYNVHGCGGMDGKVSPARIARVIAQYEPDIVALQECYGKEKGDQARAIAEELKAVYHFPDALPLAQDDYGNAILSVHPLRPLKAGILPTLPGRSIERRGALWVAVDLRGREFNFINTHLGLFSLERQRQADALMGEEWLGDGGCRGPVILCGDFNAFPSSTVYRTLTTRLFEAQDSVEGHKPRNTFFGRYPVSRIDHVFCSPEFKSLKVEVPRTHLTRLASDHLPIVAEISLQLESVSAPSASRY